MLFWATLNMASRHIFNAMFLLCQALLQDLSSIKNSWELKLVCEVRMFTSVSDVSDYVPKASVFLLVRNSTSAHKQLCWSSSLQWNTHNVTNYVEYAQCVKSGPQNRMSLCSSHLFINNPISSKQETLKNFKMYCQRCHFHSQEE